MKLLSLLSLCLLSINSLAIEQNGTYRYSLDLRNVKDDKLHVELITPAITQDEIVFNLPKMIPGTYAIYNFGRFVSNLHAYGKDGSELPVTAVNENSWKITGAATLQKIDYEIDDTWDADTSNFVFEPAGTDISAQHFLLNAGGIFGYFEGMKSNPFQLSISKPENFYGSTPLSPVSTNAVTDVYSVPSYMELVDSPIMYNIPDTTTIDVGGSQILISVFSPGKKVNSAFVASKIKEILFAARTYLGGKLPINRYAFIISLHEGKSGSGGDGALEHSYSSVYYLPDMDQEAIAQNVKDVATHEFYHIVTPLSIHSEEIGNFDYQNPKMSRHLWLYEGVTEYTASYVQLRQGLITLDRYMDVMKDKIIISKTYFNDTIPFTVMSKNCLDKYKSQYVNVYQKGALIALCLDIRLRKLSGGKKGLQDLINQLALKYGKNKSFKDEELIPEIVAMTSPEIGLFFKKYVEGGEPLPLEETFAEIGLMYKPEEAVKDFSLGGISLGYDTARHKYLYVEAVDKIDAFGKRLDYEVDDELVSLNGEELVPQNFLAARKAWAFKTEEGDKVRIVVLRKDKKGKVKEKTLKARAIKVDVVKKFIVRTDDNASPSQISFRNNWMGKVL